MTDTPRQLEQAWLAAQLWKEQALLQAGDCISAERDLSRLRRDAVIVPDDAIEKVLAALLDVRPGGWDMSVIGASPEWNAAERIVQQIRSWTYTADCDAQCSEQHTYQPPCVQHVAVPAELSGLAAAKYAAVPTKESGDAI